MSFPNHDFCNPCLKKVNKSERAEAFCQQCKVSFCSICAENHRRLTVSSTHTLENKKSKRYNMEKEHKIECVCDYCNRLHGESLCLSCNLMLCKICIKHHKRNHAPRKTPHDCSTDLKLCSGCKRYGYICASERICAGCVTFFCSECFFVHKCKNDTKRTQVSFYTPCCEPCDCMTIITSAKFICIECDEFMCEQCSNLHMTSKRFQSHKPRSMKVHGRMVKASPLCESCKRSHNEEPAMFTCSDCDNELFCESCATQHTTFKHTRYHKITLNVPHVKLTDEKEAQTERVGKEEKETETFPNEDSLRNLQHTPGKPEALHIGIDSLTLTWEAAESFDGSGYYQISYIELDEKGRWLYVNDHTLKVPNTTISSLNSNTAYKFRVRLVNEIGEGPYSPISDRIITRNSSAGMLMGFCEKLHDGNPSPDVYMLRVSEKMEARNEKAKARKFEIGASTKGCSSTEKSILLVGTSGCGKRTIIDNMINYILGVRWTDSFRFTIREVKSDWINTFSIRPEQGSRLQYQLNIIDVPSLDSSRDVAENIAVIEQMRHLLSGRAEKGIDYLDAVCFVIKSTDSKLTRFQDCMFQYLLSCFGQNLKDNIFVILSFSDSKESPILHALQQHSLPFRNIFALNSSALFLANVGLKSSTIVPHHWNAAEESFDIFFKELDSTKVQGMKQTEVLIEQQLRQKNNYDLIRKQVDNILRKANELRNEQSRIAQEEITLETNKGFSVVKEITLQVYNELPQGSYAINCTLCKQTCSKNVHSQTDKIEKCDAMDSAGRCKKCSKKCDPMTHKIESNVYTNAINHISKIDPNKKKAHDEAMVELRRLEHRVNIMSQQMNEMCETLRNESKIMNDCHKKIEEVSLWPHVNGLEREIDIYIEREKDEGREGFLERIRRMKEFRKYLEITSNIEQFTDEARSILGVVGRNRPENADALSNLTRFAELFVHLNSD